MNTIKQRGTFISYSRKDSEYALKLARELKSAGYLVWLDQLDIRTGARWDDEVERALRESEIFMIILTPASIASENVKDEIGYAIDHGKRILPVLMEDCAIPLRLRRFQYVDFTTMKFGEGVDRAKELLQTFINEPLITVASIDPVDELEKTFGQQATPKPSVPIRNQQFQRRWIAAGAAMLALAACLGALGGIIMLRGFSFIPVTGPSQTSPIDTQIQQATLTHPSSLPTQTHLPATSLQTRVPTILPPTIIATAVSLQKTSYYLPDEGTPNNNGYVGPFCCTGQTAIVYTTGGSPIGYVYFYDFPGGGYGDVAANFSVLISGITDADNVNSPLQQSSIDFVAAEMSVGESRSANAGSLNYSVTITQVDFETFDNQPVYNMGTIAIRVDVSLNR